MTRTDTMDDTTTWKLIHRERAILANTLDGLSTTQWAAPSCCEGWTVHLAAAHVLAGAEQTGANFMKEMATNAFRFNKMIDRAARRYGKLTAKEIIERLRAATTTTNHPPAPVMTMLGEVVVHGADIRRTLGLTSEVASEATTACLSMYTNVRFPVGTKKRIAGLKLVATDVGWSYGTGPEVSGPGQSLLLAMTGRVRGLDDLAGDGLADLRARMGVGASH